MNKSAKILSDIVVYSKYAKYLPKLHRRETWEEVVNRNRDMHIRKYPKLRELITDVYKSVINKEVLPSMRSLQFGGKPIELSPNRLYNCAYAPIDDTAVFGEIMFLLLGGTGFGYSVQQHHIDKLPDLVGPKSRRRRHLIGDSIEGWATAVRVLTDAYFYGRSDPEFDFGDIREKGTLLKTSGGRAPGPQPLADCLYNIRKILNTAIGDRGHACKLTSLECHDIVCYIADSVLAGGIRRAALISLFSFDDEAMLTCKYGNWWELHPQRARANNSAVALRHKIRKKDFYQFYDKVRASGCGEPGIYFSNDKDYGANPCVTGDTWILTTEGARQVKDLVAESFSAVVNGNAHHSDGFWSTGVKPVYELKTRRGLKLKLTDNHQLLRYNFKEGPDTWTELKNLSVGDSICISNHDLRRDYPYNYDRTQIELGWLLGSLVGDGTFSKKAAHLDYWGETASELANYAIEVMKSNLKHRSDLGITSCVQDGKLRISCVGVKDLASKYGIVQGNKVITDQIEQSPKWFKLGFLRGLFDADGSVQGTQSKGVSIRLNQSNLPLLERVQRMLSSIGITSTIYKRRDSQWRSLPNGKGGYSYYETKDNYELVISGQGIMVYDYWIGFEDPAKKLKISGLIAQYHRTPNQQKFFEEIESITYVGEEEVFDCTVDGVHEFCANGIRAHNCVEIGLRPCQFCNLTTINVSDVTTQDELNRRVTHAAIIGTLQASYTNFHYLRDTWQNTTEKEALLGVSMTGIASGGILGLDLQQAAQVAVNINKEIAEMIGINSAARITCIKPEGTASLVVGSSSGIHAWHSKYYIRRLRFSKEEPIYKYLRRAIPELIEDDMLKPEVDAVVSVPIQAPDGAITRNESALDLLGRGKLFSSNWVRPGHIHGQNTHNVSMTVSIKDNEWDEVRDWMWNNRDSYNGITVFPHHSSNLPQLPFEECDINTYNSMLEKVRNIDLRKVAEMEDNTQLAEEVACSGGVCTITRL